MSVKIVCPHCDKDFDDWEAYANHILEKHPHDKERCTWAERAKAADHEILPEQDIVVSRTEDKPGLQPAEVTTSASRPYTWDREKQKWVKVAGVKIEKPIEEPQAPSIEAKPSHQPRTCLPAFLKSRRDTMITLATTWVIISLVGSLYSELGSMTQGYVLLWIVSMIIAIPIALAVTIRTILKWKELS